MDTSMQLRTGTGSPMINYRKDAKKAVKFTFMVAGELGTGKTTFVNCLLDKRVMPHAYEGAGLADTRTILFTLASAVALPNTSLLKKNTFSATSAADEPGIALTETKVELVDDDNVRLNLTIIDTPGFGDNLDNEVCFLEMETYLKQQFDAVLAEETRIRRNPRFVDTRVHVLLYFITPTGHGLRELDIACMKRLAKYVNVIPVVGRADSFTAAELARFKLQIQVDIERFNVPTFKFDTFMDEYDQDEDSDLIEECRFLTRLQPFAVISSEQEFEIKDTHSGATKTIKARQYPWGLVDVNNPKYSDFPVLRLVLLGLHLQDLKDLTHDFLYETYRTERLSEVTGQDSADYDNKARGAPQGPDMLATVPSLSNLAQLTGNDTSLQLDFEDPQASPALSKKPRSMLYDEEDDKSLAPENSLMVLSKLSYSSSSVHRNNTDSASQLFKRMSIGPQRSQLRQISETVPYVIRHERIVERQQKLEEMELASAKELESRALLLEQKAAQLKARERALLEKLERYKQAEASKNTTVAEDDDDNDTATPEDDHSLANYTAVSNE
ncbi:septin 1 family protein [Metschnikowia aff. pulcherrima]|uniref:Septin 1 family protein n=1 Tax=Metschnikowia aff. pulcherrima TaxID=2163413 RepID=A0A4P6XJK4_9ASCO|nr:septin 1 family protein [Metschnikowia aff. pulcherrima]